MLLLCVPHSAHILLYKQILSSSNPLQPSCLQRLAIVNLGHFQSLAAFYFDPRYTSSSNHVPTYPACFPRLFSFIYLLESSQKVNFGLKLTFFILRRFQEAQADPLVRFLAPQQWYLRLTFYVGCLPKTDLANKMDRCWYGDEVGQDDGYIHTQGWLTQNQQEDQQGWDEAGTWNHGPYEEPNGFDGFENPHYDGLPSPDKEVKEEVGDQNEDMKVGNGYQGLIRNEMDYYMENNARLRADLHEKKTDGAVSGAPTDDEKKQYWVGRLYDAFKNTININDKNCKNGKPAQSAQRLAGSYYPPKEIEMVCWKIYVSDISV